MNEDMVEASFDWISEQSQVHNRGTQYKKPGLFLK